MVIYENILETLKGNVIRWLGFHVAVWGCFSVCNYGGKGSCSGYLSKAPHVPGPLVFQAQPTVSQGLETWPLPRMCWSGHWSVTGQLAQDCVLVAAFGERKEKGASTETLDSLAGNGDRLGNAVQRRCCSEQRVLINCPLGGSRAHSIIPIFVFLLNKECWRIFWEMLLFGTE